MKNIYVFGGSFDPPHLGHVMIATNLIVTESELDELWILPCVRQEGKNLTAFDDRFTMCLRAFKWLPKTEISCFEYALGKSITAYTLKKLKEVYLDFNLHFVVGSDILSSILKWEDGDQIEKYATLKVIGRMGTSLAHAFPAVCPAISSTEVRIALREKDNKQLQRLLPRNVLNYIQDKGLYSSDFL